MHRTRAVASSGCVVAAVEATSTISFTSAMKPRIKSQTQSLHELFRSVGACGTAGRGSMAPKKGHALAWACVVAAGTALAEPCLPLQRLRCGCRRLPHHMLPASAWPMGSDGVGRRTASRKQSTLSGCASWSKPPWKPNCGRGPVSAETRKLV